MKTSLTFVLAFWASCVFAQGFGNASINFMVPDGGQISGSVSHGFVSTNGFISNNSDGNQAWGLVDMNADGKKDLVVFAQNDANGDDAVFDVANNPHWRVYFNGGSQFNSSGTDWSLPEGGKVVGNTIFGYNGSSGFATSGSSDGNQSWSLFDINGDRLPDLVVTAQVDINGELTVFGLGTNNFWKVYLNSGTGFSTNAINYAIPQGGFMNNGVYYGFTSTAGIAAANSSEGNMTWGMLDMNGDDRPDLIVTSQVDLNGDNVIFGFGNSPYWKVFFNTGSAFNTSAYNWSVPAGGYMSGSRAFGFNTMNGLVANTTEGNQTWSVMDINGDHRPDLVIASQNDLNGDNVVFGGSTPYWKVYLGNGGGFVSNVINWSTPTGGKLTTSVAHNFNSFAYIPLSTEMEGSMAWSVMDVTGDGKPDLVATGALDLNKDLTVFGLSSTPYWKLYRNNGNGFDGMVNFNVPSGGQIKTTVFGFNTSNGNASSSTKANNPTWTVTDINGDDQLDLVVTAERISNGGDIEVFGNGSNPFWKVYLNTAPTSGIQPNRMNSGILIYPNPTQNKVVVKGPSVFKGIAYILMDPMGRIMITGELDDANQVDLTTVPSGCWFLQVQSQVIKIVKD